MYLVLSKYPQAVIDFYVPWIKRMSNYPQAVIDFYVPWMYLTYYQSTLRQ